MTTSTTGSASLCRRRCRPARRSACCRFVPWTMSGSTPASSRMRQRLRVPAEADDLQRVLREARRDEVRQRQRRLLHRAPAALGHHRERQVDAQRHRCGRPPLGLDDLEVLDVERHRTASRDASATLAGRTPHRVADRAYDVERLLVAELPGAATRRSPRRPRPRRAGRARPRRPRSSSANTAAARCRRGGAAPSGSASDRRAPRVASPAGAARARAPAAGARRRRRPRPSWRSTASTSMSSSVAPGCSWPSWSSRSSRSAISPSAPVASP